MTEFCLIAVILLQCVLLEKGRRETVKILRGEKTYKPKGNSVKSISPTQEILSRWQQKE